MDLPHLILDLKDCDPEKLNDLQLAYEVLDKLPEQIDMVKVSPPILFPYEGGITGFVVIATSHIAIHTFPDDKCAFLDVFSCKDFDVDGAAEYLIEHFAAGSADKQFVCRGEGFGGKGL
jgi:S-adenosylmethionine decarboxylase